VGTVRNLSGYATTQASGLRPGIFWEGSDDGPIAGLSLMRE